MKLPQLFTKTPSHKRFEYTPRHYDPRAEELRQTEERIRRELSLEQEKHQKEENSSHYRSRIAGSFRAAKKTATVQRDPSASLLRLIVLMLLTVGLIAFIEYGRIALYGVALVFIPFYLYLKFRKFRR
jgi:Flp pilus assembly protein TadB